MSGILSVFYKSGNGEKEKQTSPSPVNSAQNFTGIPAPSISFSPATPVQADDTFYKGIEDLLKQTPASTGYNEFCKQLTALEKIIPDRATLFKAAFTTAMTILASGGQNLSPSDIVNAVTGLQNVLDNELKEFSAQEEQDANTATTQINQEIQGLDRTANEKKAMVEKLNAEIAQISDQLEASKNKLAGLAQIKANRMTQFTAAYGTHKARISSFVDEIKRYLMS